MLDLLSTQASLMRLKTRGDDDFTIALLDSFAVVCDILTFYSERSANEHYLRTATDVNSMRELAKLVGYKPAPGVAASTSLAITVQSPPPALPGPRGQTPAPLLVPAIIPVAAGLQAQSVPDPGQVPVTFETVAPIEVRWAWNALRPRQTRPLSASAANATPNHLRLVGLIGSLSVGDWLLVVVNQGATPVATGVNRIAAVALENATSTTLVKFDGAAPDPDLAADPSAAPPRLSGTVGDAVIESAIKGHTWVDQTQLVANAAKLQWSLLALEENINALNAAGSTVDPPTVQVFKLGVRAALFGHNAPLYAALPNYTAVGGVAIGTVFSVNWDGDATHAAATIGSDPWVSAGWVSLDQTYQALVKSSWVVLQSPGQQYVRKVLDSRSFSRIGFMLSGKVTQLSLDGDQTAVNNLPIRTTSVLGSTDQFSVAEEPVTLPVAGAQITLATAQLGLRLGQQVVVTGSALGLSERSVSEVRSIVGIALVDGYSQITLDRDLSYSYDAASVTLNANVAPATHGETKSEILGSGAGAASYQRFFLKQPPLTYVGAATPSGIASTLEVRVNGVRWRETDWLAGQGSTERVYTTSIDERGNTVIQFGDGAENGARLPTGQNNVTAKYRQGIGSAGNVRAGQITTLLTRPMGVQGVINPLAATGGGDPELIDSARRNVPVTTRALDRIVALEDVGDFARASAAVAKAEAVWAWDGRRRVACVTVAGAGGAAIDTGTKQFSNLLAAMLAGSDGTIPIVLCSHVPRSFTVGATLTVDPTLDADAVVTAAKAALRNAFGFDAREFMQPVYRSEVYAVLQAVPGVIALTLDSFRYADLFAGSFPAQGPGDPPLIADPPVLVGGTLVGAQLLTLETGLLPGVVSA
jgi:uncharacterized phage protein gp47/JayE